MNTHDTEAQLVSTPVAITADDLLPEEEMVIADDSDIVESESDDKNVATDEVNSSVPVSNGSPERSYHNPNVTLTYDPRKPMPTDKPDNRDPLGIVSLSGSELADFVSQQAFKANADSLDETYADALRKGVNLTFNEDVVDNAISNAKDLQQNVQYEERSLEATVPIYKSRSGDVLTGIKAIAQIRRALKQGSFLNFPCWSSGVWITLRAPTAFELANYYDSVSEEIIELGKGTGGAIFDNTSVYLAKNLIDLVQSLVHACSIKDFAGGKHHLRDILMIDDLQTIAWAIAVCMYPNGYPFEEPCTVDIQECTVTHKTILNISKLHWVDKSRLTHWQTQFMSDKNIERSLDEIRKYQIEAQWLQSVKCDNYPGFKILFKTPTIGEHIEAGYRWIGDVEESITAILPNLSNTKLNSLIMDRAGLTLLRSYGHYVKAFIYDNGSTVNTKSDIDATLNNMCMSSEIATQFTKDVQEHISKSLITMIAIPRYKCPSCNKDMHPEEKTHPHLIPIDAVQLFFDLRDQKLQLV